MELENEQNTHKFCALFKKKNNATTLADQPPSHMENGVTWLAFRSLSANGKVLECV